MKKHILFDLDGTLTDPGVGITNSVIYSLRKMGIEPPRREALYKFIGPPLWESYEKYYGMTHDQAVRAVGYYREYYPVTGMFENVVYPGITELLGALQGAGRQVVLATSKPVVYTRQILSHFSLDGYFSFVSGSELDGRRVNKDEVIAYAVAECGLDPEDAVMVGDRENDIFGARKNCMESVGVLYGYGDRAELAAAGAHHIVGTVGELSALLQTL